MGNRVAVWHANSSVRTDAVLTNHGDVIDDVFLVAYTLTADGMQNMSIQNTVETFRAKWPNIKWWLTVQCFSSTVFRKMANPSDPLTIQVMGQLDNIYAAYPWLTGLTLTPRGSVVTSPRLKRWPATGHSATTLGPRA